MTAASPAPAEVQELTESFRTFTRISHEMETAYRQLRSQAERIDLELAHTNQTLQEKVRLLNEMSSHLQAVLGCVNAAVVVTDLEGRITLVNRPFERLVGRVLRDLSGMRKADLEDEDCRPVCAPGGLLATPPRTLQILGERRVVRSSLTPIVDPMGQELGTVETLVDETESEALREELARRNTLSALGEMAAGIAHELRNPMGAIEGFAHLLRRAVGDERPQAVAHADRIIRGVRKANAIITNLLCFARPDMFRPRKASLLPVFLTLQSTYQASASEKTQVVVRPPEPRDLCLRCDPALLERLLINLIDNARTALKGEGTVEVSAIQHDGELLLRVEDDGPGIPEELRERLFLPFVTGRAEGTGLGLAIVHRIVDLHHGRIKVESQPGRGTLFEVFLPALAHTRSPTGRQTVRPETMEAAGR